MVRELSFRTGRLGRLNDLHAEIARTVVERNGGRTVLPSLLAFAWPKMLPVKVHGDIARLLSPSVVRLMFHPDRSDALGSENVLRSIRNAAPFLEEVTSMGAHPSAMRVVDELVQFQHLRVVQVFAALPHDDIYALLSKLRLTELRVCIFLDPGSTIRPIKNESLRELTIHGAPPDLAAIFPAWSFPALQCAEIALLDQNLDGGADLHTPDLFAAIVAPLSPTALLTLDIAVGVTHPSSRARSAALPLAQFLRPTFQLRGLRSLRLTITGHVALSADDDVFAELAASWPSLCALQLEFRAWHADGPVPTPLVLLSLARSCPDLQKLVLPYLDHAVELEALPQRNVLEAAAHPLRQLFIADDRSKENITPEVAEALCDFVGGLFPRLSPHFRRYLREPRKAWTEVLNRLRGGRRR
ncbi:hypothetical protein GSI_04322 [Ganoderma sinense ZZ0214-1]|uniref:Uncharacterized protein n=1 Tax=Ganoderma sinense ZZ0214-1 TaxID=1077348 RepID=A0A2G8SIZ8_9APHY|nr:hypothetical protein GSI_04322 [Ganoderma sinense ZZ0214-1]